MGCYIIYVCTVDTLLEEVVGSVLYSISIKQVQQTSFHFIAMIPVYK